MQLRRLVGTLLVACAILCGNLARGQAASASTPVTSPDVELKSGTELTRQGMLREAIPHLLTARRLGADQYASSFNLAICYLGIGQYRTAIDTLESLRSSGADTTAVKNLLAQAYVGDGQMQRAFEIFHLAAAETPRDEKLYAFVADACTDHQDFDLGLKVVETGLQQLPDSARLHYERGLFLAQLDRFEEAKPYFERAAALAPGSYIALLATVQESLYEDNYLRALDLLRAATEAGSHDYRMLSLLGSVLLHQGAAPGQPQFAEARAALEESARERPDYSATQIALGRLYAMEGRMSDAVIHLEIGRRLEPNNPEVYTSLAHAYRRLGKRDKEEACLAQLTRLLAENKAAANSPIR